VIAETWHEQIEADIKSLRGMIRQVAPRGSAKAEHLSQCLDRLRLGIATLEATDALADKLEARISTPCSCDESKALRERIEVALMLLRGGFVERARGVLEGEA
jgi:hypothetical protein